MEAAYSKHLIKSLLLFVACIAPAPLIAKPIAWPTPNTAFLDGKPREAYIQPTVSGKVESGLFGCVRNGGHRFHGGVDLKALQKNKKGEPLDPIFAILPGKLAYYNPIGANSSYGRYIVIEHCEEDIPLFSLYAHLSSIEPHISLGKTVRIGERIGTMGRSATKPIPKTRAHLHFGLGLRLSDHFDSWYTQQKFGTPNKHGTWNGMNMVFLDPLDYYRARLSSTFQGTSAYIKNLPTALTLQIKTTVTPSFLKRYTRLIVNEKLPEKPITGWQIEFTAAGLPKKWTPLYTPLPGLKHSGSISLISYDEAILRKNPGIKLVQWNKKGNPSAAKKLKQIIDLFF
jgi:peptidoglycan LD-endopeptidase LytH